MNEILLNDGELEALFDATSEVMAHPDVVEALFPDPERRALAYDAWHKLRITLWKMQDLRDGIVS